MQAEEGERSAEGGDEDVVGGQAECAEEEVLRAV